MGCPTLTYQKAKIEPDSKKVRNYKIKTDDFYNKINESYNNYDFYAGSNNSKAKRN